MELKKLTTEFCRLMQCEVPELTESMRKVLRSEERRNCVFDSYITLVDGDLNTDYLQKIFQYYQADRKEKCQDFTPKSIARLVSRVTGNGGTVYDCCAGSGALTIQKWADSPDAEYICEELDDNAIPYLLFNLAVRNISGWVVNRDILTLKTMAVYRLCKGKKYSAITVEPQPPEIKADCILSNPPYNIPWSPPEKTDERFKGCDMPPKGNANYAFVLTALTKLKSGGKCAFVLPMSVLSATDETNIRKYLVQSEKLERVILLPERMFESTSIPSCVLVFGAGNKDIKMFDCRAHGTVAIREQNGQFGGSQEKRTYKKEIATLSPELIERLCGDCENEPGFSAIVATEKIAEQDWILTPSRYIKYVERQAGHRPYKDIVSDINRICRERNVLKITINETQAKQMGLAELYEMEQESNRIAEEMQKTFDLLGEKVIRQDYLRMSKYKEFKIENQDKELLSSLLSIFMPMWSQHIFYLNAEENRYLAELRDALLPDLMSGKVSVGRAEDHSLA